VLHFEGLEAIVAIFIAHCAHLFSVLVLYQLTLVVFARTAEAALTAAFLHIVSPAGLFLSAPFAESSCALLTFGGSLLFAKSLGPRGQSSTGQDLLVLASGVAFGIATTLRSNGILSGLLLLEEAFRTLFILKDGLNWSRIRRLLATGLGGLTVLLGFLLPQYIAWSEYCGQSSLASRRPWCENNLPSIYTFVQVHYW
jgi:phosphatidylinositol glycan class V